MITSDLSPSYVVDPRAEVASRAMQGILASPTDSTIQSKDPEFVAKLAVECANALFAELNKTKSASIPILRIKDDNRDISNL